MRFHRFALIKPLVLLTTLPLEWRLCQLTCVARPGASHRPQRGLGAVPPGGRASPSA
jgi:hypothetical protein